MRFAKGRTQDSSVAQQVQAGVASASLQQSQLLQQQTEQVTAIQHSPQQQLQRKQLQGLVSQQISLEEEPMQGKFAVVQQAGLEEEEPMQGKFAVVQQAGLEEEEPLQGKFAVVQQAGLEEEPLQGKFEPAVVSQRQADTSINNTGMPDQLKSGIESLSGYAMDDVKVHYNSAKPATMQAHAYAQGTDIHIAPGQEKHLPHEAWHVVQQKQGRVTATTQLKGEAINDDPGLEHEADVMGAKAMHFNNNLTMQKKNTTDNAGTDAQSVVQRVIYPNIPALLAAVWPGPGAVPNLAAFSQPLQELFADAENQLPLTDVIHAPGIGRIAEAGLNPAPPPAYILNYDPALGTPDFLISSMLHELLHVSTQENYRKNGVAFDFLNMNLPAGLGIPAAVGIEINAQLQILDQNLQDAVAVATADGALPALVQAHILNRLNNYALVMPDVHYDTVLADILAYMELNGVNNGPTFAFITRLVKESTNRRLVAPWWGTKSARRVDRSTPAWQIWKW